MNRLGRVAIAALLMLSALWTGDVAQADDLAAPAFTLSKIFENVIEDTAMVGYTISSTGGAIASYSISPALSTPGLVFSTSTGLLSGTPATAYDGEPFDAERVTYTITATNATSTASRTFHLAVLFAFPGVPSQPTAVATNGSIKVTVVAGSGGTPYSYLVTASPTVSGVTKRCKIVVWKPKRASSCKVQGLVTGTSYTFTATAHNTKGRSSASTASTSVIQP
jgi:Putative Ig domain